MQSKMVFAAVHGGSFAEAERMLANLASLKVRAKRIWRATQRAGERRTAEAEQATRAYEALPLPAQGQAPRGATVPEVAGVSMDGGRFQLRDRRPSETEPGDNTTCWREMKVGCLTSMTGDVAAADPCPELPATFADPDRMRELAREIKGFSADCARDETRDETSPAEDCGDSETTRDERPGRPLVVHRSVVATARDVTAFGPLLAAAAYALGFHAALRKAFVGDGSETNWSVWRKYFSHYTPILDFVHALMYVYAAATAGEVSSQAWERYRRWARRLWSGAIDALLAEMAERLNELGPSTADEPGTPRAQVAESLGYLTRQRERMKYDEYRRLGLPITSTLVESTIKQINRRVKGTEKFWSNGIEPMLTLVADELTSTLRPPPCRPAGIPACRQAA